MVILIKNPLDKNQHLKKSEMAETSREKIARIVR